MQTNQPKLEQELKGKNILFVGLKFYHFHTEILSKLRGYAERVDFYHERHQSVLYGVVNRLANSRLKALQELHYRRLLWRTQNRKYDYLFVIRGLMMPRWFIEEIKARNPGIRCLMYQWDSNEVFPYLDLPEPFDVIDLFDQVYSFDYRDVRQNPGRLKYLPTFTVDEIQQWESQGEESYDFFYFGSYLPPRYKGLLKFEKFAKRFGYRLKAHFFMEFRYFWIERFRGFKLNRQYISHQKMDRQEYFQHFCNSKVIVDVSHPRQTGLALRVIDALAAGKRVATTNSWIYCEPGLDPEQVCLIDMDKLEIPESFMADRNFKKKDYSIDTWLERIFLNNYEEMKQIPTPEENWNPSRS